MSISATIRALQSQIRSLKIREIEASRHRFSTGTVLFDDLFSLNGIQSKYVKFATT